MLNIGPFSIHVVVMTIIIAITWLTIVFWTHKAGASGKLAGGILLDALLPGLLIARLAYVIRWWPDYLASPWSIFAIGDGGFYAWPGLLAGLAWILWRSHKTALPKSPALCTVLAGTLLWQSANVWINTQQQNLTLPDIHLTTLDETVVTLHQFSGKPIIINLWATWCPPCRREMPAFAKAQTTFPEVNFILINQGEDSQTAQNYLHQQKLFVQNVLLDPAMLTMTELQAGALPSTLFFDAKGQLRRAHTGELTFAALKDAVGKLKE